MTSEAWMNARITLAHVRRALLVMVVVSGSAAPGIAQTTRADSSTSAEETIVLDRINRACAAFEKGDVAYLTDFLDETFTLTDSRGQVTTRAQNLAEVKAREPRYDVPESRYARQALWRRRGGDGHHVDQGDRGW
jgi:hypothetical protein